MLRKALALLLLLSVLSGCNPLASQQNSVPKPNDAAHVQPAGIEKSSRQDAAQQPIATQTAVAAVPSATPTQSVKMKSTPTQSASTAAAVADAPQATATRTPGNPSPAVQAAGPDQFPEGVNPLTGLPVTDQANLALSPALVSITNFPVTARPQAGLSFSPYVFEMYIGEGMTRFLALFYGDYPVKGTAANAASGMKLDDDHIGPIRSGRLPFESLRKLYNGFLVMASASANVRSALNSYTNIFGSDEGDINSALIPATKLSEIAAKNPDRVKAGALSGQRFDPAVPASGKDGKMIWIPFSFLNQVIWRYDAASGGYFRYQDDADGKTFIQVTDRLNGQPLTYENVVILFASHVAKKETLINIDLEYINKMPALLFRDGKMYQIYWTTANGAFEKSTGLMRPIRFIDAQGNPFPLKPGQTWVEIVQQFTRYNETVDSKSYFEMKQVEKPGTGNWVIHFYPPAPEK